MRQRLFGLALLAGSATAMAAPVFTIYRGANPSGSGAVAVSLSTSASATTVDGDAVPDETAAGVWISSDDPPTIRINATSDSGQRYWWVYRSDGGEPSPINAIYFDGAEATNGTAYQVTIAKPPSVSTVVPWPDPTVGDIEEREFEANDNATPGVSNLKRFRVWPQRFNSTFASNFGEGFGGLFDGHITALADDDRFRLDGGKPEDAERDAGDLPTFLYTANPRDPDFGTKINDDPHTLVAVRIFASGVIGEFDVHRVVRIEAEEIDVRAFEPEPTTETVYISHVHGPIGIISVDSIGAYSGDETVADFGTPFGTAKFPGIQIIQRGRDFSGIPTEVRQITTTRNASSPFRGDIALQYLQSIHGTIGEVRARGIAAGDTIGADNGRVTTLIGEKGVAWILVRAGFGGDELTAGTYAPSTGNAVQGGNLDILFGADYFLARENTAIPAADFAPADGELRTLRSVRTESIDGNMNGWARMRALRETSDTVIDRIRVDGDLTGNLEFVSAPTTDPNEQGEVPATRTVWVGGSKHVDDRIEGGLSANPGLRGQIIVNGRNEGGTWLSEFYFGAIFFGDDLDNYFWMPSYVNSAASIGGGAVGLAPFRLHREDSVPVNTNDSDNDPSTFPYNTMGWDEIGSAEVLPAYNPSATPPVNEWSSVEIARAQLYATAADDDEARLRFYGPVDYVPSVSRTLTVERADNPGFVHNPPTQSVTDESAKFEFDISSPTQVIVRDVRVRLLCEQRVGGYYRVVRNQDNVVGGTTTNGLRCVDVVGNPSVFQFAHYFYIGGCCIADVAGPGQTPTPDGDLTSDDIALFIGWFFALDPRADVAGGGQTPGADGDWTADDIVVFINAFFAGCDPDKQPVPCEQEIIGGGEDEGEEGLSSIEGDSPTAAMIRWLMTLETDAARLARLQEALNQARGLDGE